ncbi:putative palmitoyltransferase ZDHHC13 [Osmerus eperlanus]|uniref:putative palmitoyltransferase ZDHHC13 n=1 Tax=Osmerus eperlanus TaxID=29151 RepID=UPI002E0DC858
MDWRGDNVGHSHSHMGESCHGHGGHSHGPKVQGFSGATHGLMPGFHGQFGARADQMMDPTQQPKKRSHMDESSSWDIVKATQFGILERCKELVEAGYDVRQPDKENVSLLHWAAINNRTEVVKYYMSKGAVIDQLGGDLNSTPLHWAIRQGHLSMVIQLLRYGADPSLPDGEGYRSLHLAVLFQHMPIAAYLMAKGQEVDLPDNNGQTPLMLAAQKIIGTEPSSFLVKCNASVSAVDQSRNTALHCAVLAGNVDAAHVLLEAGASVDTENSNGHTPLELAHQVNSPLLVHTLNLVRLDRLRSGSRCLRLLHRYRVCVQFLLCVAVLGSVGVILDWSSDSWLLKSLLLGCVLAGVNLFCRKVMNHTMLSLIPAASLMASVFWMLVTWCLWFLPDGPSAVVQVLFTLNATALLYYYLRSCRTDPGTVRATEEEKKMNIVVLAEAGCLDPRIFCTSCMIKKPVRANHCHVCDACVARQDHHSVWINGCIGARNHHFFLLFLLSLTLLGVWVFYGCLSYWWKRCPLHYQEVGLWSAAAQLLSCSPWVLGVGCLALFHTTWASITLLLQLHQIAFYGLTTAERTNLMFYQRKLPHPFSLRQNPYNQGVGRNLASFFQLRCCGLLKPPQGDWSQQHLPGRDQPLFSHPDVV